MARQTIVQLTDDLDGSSAEESVSFALRGTEYEIDLNAKNVAALEKALEKFVVAGRRVAPARGRSTRPARTPVRASSSGVREWARANGYEVNDRGRVPAEIREAYEAAQG